MNGYKAVPLLGDLRFFIDQFSNKMRIVFEVKVAPNKRHDFVLKIKRHYKLHHVKRSAMLLHGLLIHSIDRLKKSV